MGRLKRIICRWLQFCVLIFLSSSALEAGWRELCHSALERMQQIRASMAAHRLRSAVVSSDFVSIRNLSDYLHVFGEPLMEDLLRLNSSSRWLMGGAGEGLAADGYFRKMPVKRIENSLSPINDQVMYVLRKAQGAPSEFSMEPADIERRESENDLSPSTIEKWNQIVAIPLAERAHVTAISYRIGRNHIPNDGGRVDFITGQWFEQIPNKKLGSFDLVTDFFGIVTYAPDPSEVLNKYLEMLRAGGVLYLRHADIFIQSPSGVYQSLGEWLREQGGLSIEFIDERTLRITKTQSEVRLPSLKLLAPTWRDKWLSLIPVNRFRVQ